MTRHNRDREQRDPDRDIQRQADFDYDRSRSSRHDLDWPEQGWGESWRGESGRDQYGREVGRGRSPFGAERGEFDQEPRRPPTERRESWGQPVWLEGRRGGRGPGSGRGFGAARDFGYGEGSEREGARGGGQAGQAQYDSSRGRQFEAAPSQWRERFGGSQESGDPRFEMGRGYGGMVGGRVWDEWAEGEGESFAGRGPKGYRRSDERICEDISERLTEHPQIDASECEVKVQGGEVTLTGMVNSRRAKRMAEDLAEQVSGVKEVSNQLRVKGSGSQATSDHVRPAGTSGSQSSGTPSSGGRSRGE
jgi:hypothetical protein